MTHFSIGLSQMLEEDNANISHLLTNIRKNSRFENLLMSIVSYDKGIQYNCRIDEFTQLME